MKAITGRRIWVTGASSGIGRALAVALAKFDNDVVVSGRNEQELEYTRLECPERIKCVAFDVADRSANLAAAAKVQQELGGLDIAVLNAGTCEYLDVKSFDSTMIKRVMDINYMGFVYGVEAVLPLLRKGVSPYLVGMSSTVAYTGLPRAEAYGSSKAAIRHFLQSLRLDLDDEGVDVSIICPGFVKTPLTDKNEFAMPMRITPEAAASYIIRGMEKRKHEISFPPLFAFILKRVASLPDGLRHRLLVKLLRSNG